MPGPERRGGGFGAIALLILGLLILIPSGLCTGIMTIYPLLSALRGPNGGPIPTDFIGLALTIGLPFVLIGGLLTWLGIKRMRR
jgi:hypothetical protein